MANLVSFPQAMQHSIFTQMSAEAKAAAWREQLITFESSTVLSSTQRALIEAALTHITPALYANGSSRSRAMERASAADAAKAAKTLFPTDQAHVFDQLGHGVTPAYSFASFRLTVAEKARNFGTTLAGGTELPECYCSGWYDPCYPGTCTGHCFETFGCGPFGDMFCDGVCEN